VGGDEIFVAARMLDLSIWADRREGREIIKNRAPRFMARTTRVAVTRLGSDKLLLDKF